MHIYLYILYVLHEYYVSLNDVWLCYEPLIVDCEKPQPPNDSVQHLKCKCEFRYPYPENILEVIIIIALRRERKRDEVE